jgi:hypothetical protein
VNTQSEKNTKIKIKTKSSTRSSPVEVGNSGPIVCAIGDHACFRSLKTSSCPPLLPPPQHQQHQHQSAQVLLIVVVAVAVLCL